MEFWSLSLLVRSGENRGASGYPAANERDDSSQMNWMNGNECPFSSLETNATTLHDILQFK